MNFPEMPNLDGMIEVSHAVIFEKDTGRTLIQFNEKFQKWSFVGGKNEGKTPLETIVDEFKDETGNEILKEEFVRVGENIKINSGKTYHGTLFVVEVPKGFEPIDINGEGKCLFYEIDDIPFGEYISGDTREEVIAIIKNAKKFTKIKR